MLSGSSFDVLFMVGKRLMEMQQELENETSSGSVLAKLKLDKYTAASESCELRAREYEVRTCVLHFRLQFTHKTLYVQLINNFRCCRS